jgi:hypothetical protein
MSGERGAEGSGAPGDFYTEIAEDYWPSLLLVEKGLTFRGRRAAVNQDGF